MNTRIDTIRARAREEGADAALLTFLPDIRWACGFTGSNGLLIVRDDVSHFVSDGRYDAQARREVDGAQIHIPGYSLLKHVAEDGLLGPPCTVAIQADHVTVEQFNDLQERFPDHTWQPVAGLLVEQVAAKDEEEIAAIRAAQEITDAVFEYLCGFIEVGMTEREVAAEIVYQHLQRGAERMAFEPIVASGVNGSLPHARPTDRVLQAGELVVIDMGGFRNGYASDMTRTVALGKPESEARTAYNAVLGAQERAIEAAHAGMTGKELDAVARAVLDEAGLAQYFTHSLGHGVGLQIHEWPRVSHHVEHVLPEGATVTIEPGVYIPDQFGIRIEDIVALHANGCENLTASPKELIVL